jgi:hypothetical protein
MDRYPDLPLPTQEVTVSNPSHTTPTGTTTRTRSAHLVGVSTTALANDVRVQVWDSYQVDAEGDPLRLGDVRLTVEQALDVIARLTAATQRAVESRAAAEQIIARARVEASPVFAALSPEARATIARNA